MAKYLDLTRIILEKRERATEAPVFHLNEKQCTHLWRMICKIYDYFATSPSYLQPRGHKYLLTKKFQEFYIIVTRADAIVHQFSSEQSWLHAAIFQGNQRQAFNQLTEDLQACVASFSENTQHPIPVEASGTIWRQDVDMDGDSQRDAADLRNRLEDLLARSGLGEEERLLAHYLILRERTSSQTDISKHENPLQFDTVASGYPTSIVEHIGHGAYGSVYKVNWLGMTCVKKHFSATEDEEFMKEFVKEANVLAKLNHPHIVKLLCTSAEPEVSFVMEMMPMSLSDFIRQRQKLKQRGTMPFTLLATVDMMLQIARGVEYLHEQGVAHGHLKSSNILVDPSADEKLRAQGFVHVKLSDMALDRIGTNGTAGINMMLQLAPEKESLRERGIVNRDLKSSSILISPSAIDQLRDEGYADVKLADFGLHGQDIANRNLKSSNMLVVPSEVMQLSDEGYNAYMKWIDSTLAKAKVTRTTRKMMETSKWMASGAFAIDWKKADAYSFAMTCLEILTGKTPFSSGPLSELYARIGRGERTKLSSSIPRDLVSLLEACWHTQPNDRPLFSEITKTLTRIKRSLLEPDYALEYLEQARLVMEQRESVCRASQTFFELNDKQSTRLWQNLRIVYDAFYSCFLDFDQHIQQKCVPFFKELYVIVTRADAIVQQFNSQRSWLEAVIVQGDHRQAFKELTVDLQDCALVFYSFAQSECKTINPDFDTILSLLINVAHDDYMLDALKIGSTLEELNTQYDLTKEERQLVQYLIGREKSMSRTKDLEDDEDDKDELPPYYKDLCGYQTSIIHHIGHGASGSVYKVNWLGMTCASKHFEAPKEEILMEPFMKGFMKEVKALAKLNHPHVVKLLFMNEKPEDVSFVMEMLPMSLSDFIRQRQKLKQKGSGMPFTLLAAIDMMLQIARGMEYSHDQDIVHRDLKSNNILIAPSEDEKLWDEGYGVVKLTDLGSAKMQACASTYPTYKMMGTTNWRAPEAFQPSGRINWKKADAYSFAMTCSEILTGERPFNSKERSHLYARIESGERPELPSTCPKDLVSLLEACWDNRPSVRPSFAQIRESLTSIKRSLLHCDLKLRLKNLKVPLQVKMLAICSFVMRKIYSNLPFVVNMLYSFLCFLCLILLCVVFYFLGAQVGTTLVVCTLFYFLGVKRGRNQVLANRKQLLYSNSFK